MNIECEWYGVEDGMLSTSKPISLPPRRNDCSSRHGDEISSHDFKRPSDGVEAKILPTIG
jgi:hypothetical protein